ncbi:secretion protein [Chitinophaga sp. MD30]|nr:secretion protein [Chitinophaga sp. MD30]
MTGKFIRHTPFCLLLLCIYLCSCTKDKTLIAPDTPGPLHPPAVDSFPENKVDRTALLTLVNGLRSRGCNCGDVKMPPVPALTWNGTLEKAGWLHSKDMFEKKYFDHISPAGTTPGNRVDAVGYNWTAVGENIARGDMDEQGVILGWLTSPKHCQNMMAAQYREFAVGKYDNNWTMVLANRK